ncbi:hypothetical protein AAFF_G00428580 [Aldrovandia affinis]|uniref:Uncharacterized protein n=1 Tax=Aldrovandia affinis TaxID=143900 RepID=A0AAD7S9F5_9TELE|nr:hypothetical protein AAFF_G00428580 [Aldrovandia affinis]
MRVAFRTCQLCNYPDEEQRALHAIVTRLRSVAVRCRGGGGSAEQRYGLRVSCCGWVSAGDGGRQHTSPSLSHLVRVTETQYEL